MTRDEIAAWLVEDGWPVEPLGASTLRSRVRGDRRSFPFLVHLERAFLVVALVPYVRLPYDTDRADALMRRLLELNREMNFARLSVDEDGDVVLSVEWRLPDLSRSELRDAVDVLSFYALRHWDELSALAG
jgi:hypothetical protein